jgi:hypothetical protein
MRPVHKAEWAGIFPVSLDPCELMISDSIGNRVADKDYAIKDVSLQADHHQSE